jgi:hypothetical protein
MLLRVVVSSDLNTIVLIARFSAFGCPISVSLDMQNFSPAAANGEDLNFSSFTAPRLHR